MMKIWKFVAIAIIAGLTFSACDDKVDPVKPDVEQEENQTPETPGDQEKPEDSETPEDPETPETPENPEEPETPETPEDPETPEEPETPETPEDPEPEIPDTPEAPDTPESPETPEEPGTPENPEQSEGISMEGKQWAFTWAVMGDVPCIFDLGATETGIAYLLIDAAVYGGEGWVPYFGATYSVETTDGTSGKISMVDPMDPTASVLVFEYAELTETSVKVSNANFSLDNTEFTLCTEKVEITM